MLPTRVKIRCLVYNAKALRKGNESLHQRKISPGRMCPKRSTDMDALLMDAQIMSSKEECAVGMGQRSNNAAVKDAKIMPRNEECVLGMGQSSNDAAVKEAQKRSRKEECAKGTERAATHDEVLQMNQIAR